MKKKIGILWTPNKQFDSDEEFYKLGCGGNLGNLLYLEAIEKLFDGERVEWTSKPDIVNNTYDILIFPAANQLGKHTQLLELGKIWEKYNIPILTIGLGIQSIFGQEPKITDGTLFWLKVLINNANKFNNPMVVRGKITESFIKKHFDNDNIYLLPIGCPSQFLMTSETINKLSNQKKFDRILVYASANFHITKGIENQLIQAVTECGGSYLINSDLAGLMATRGYFDRIDAQEYLQSFYQYFNKEINKPINEWFSTYTKGFTSFEDWIAFHQTFDYCVGFRIHGCVASLLSGIPSVLIPTDNRTLELAEILCIPYIVDPYTDIVARSKALLYNFDYYKMFQKWKDNFKIFQLSITNSIDIDNQF